MRGKKEPLACIQEASATLVQQPPRRIIVHDARVAVAIRYEPAAAAAKGKGKAAGAYDGCCTAHAVLGLWRI